MAICFFSISIKSRAHFCRDCSCRTRIPQLSTSLIMFLIPKILQSGAVLYAFFAFALKKGSGTSVPVQQEHNSFPVAECDIILIKEFPSNNGQFSLNGEYIKGYHLIHGNSYWISAKTGVILYWTPASVPAGGLWVLDQDLNPQECLAFGEPGGTISHVTGGWQAFDLAKGRFVPVSRPLMECPACDTLMWYSGQSSLFDGHYLRDTWGQLHEAHHQEIWQHSMWEINLVDDLGSFWFTECPLNSRQSCIPREYILKNDTVSVFELMEILELKETVPASPSSYHSVEKSPLPMVRCAAAGRVAAPTLVLRRASPGCRLTSDPGCLVIEPISDGMLHSTLHKEIRILLAARKDVQAELQTEGVRFMFDYNEQKSSIIGIGEMFLHGFGLWINVPGTHCIRVKLFLGKEDTESKQEPIFSMNMTYEVFEALSPIVQPRPGSKDQFNKAALQMYSEECNTKSILPINIAFLADGRSIDGVKMSILNLATSLSKADYSIKALDLTCDTIAPLAHPFHFKLKKSNIEILRICSQMDTTSDIFNASWTLEDFSVFSFQHFRTASDWEQVNPSLKYMFNALFTTLKSLDILVLSNGGRSSVGAIGEVARLAEVPNILLDLGALGPTAFLPTPSITAYIAQSHYVATHCNVLAGRRPVFLLYPVSNSTAFSTATEFPEKTGVLSRRVSDPEEERSTMTIDNHTCLDLGKAKRIGFVGRLVPAKGPGLFVRMTAILQNLYQQRGGCSSLRNVEAKMIGVGPLESALRELSLGLNASIEFTGFIDNDLLHYHLRSLDVLVMPSLYPEALGLVAAEAMLMRLPVVSFGVGGTAELVHHMETGLIVKVQTPRGLASAVMELLENEPLRTKLGNGAEHFAYATFSKHRLVVEYDKVFKAISSCSKLLVATQE